MVSALENMAAVTSFGAESFITVSNSRRIYYGPFSCTSGGPVPELPEADFELDARGLDCPMPLLQAKRKLNGMQAGQCLRVVATDPGSVRDFHSWADNSGLCLLEFRESDTEFMYLLQKND